MLDLSDLNEWSDEDVVGALNQIEEGLSDNQVWWVDTLGKAFDAWDSLTRRQRVTAEGILREVNQGE